MKFVYPGKCRDTDYRLTEQCFRSLRGLGMSMEDISYVVTFGHRIRLGRYQYAVLRSCDIPESAKRLPAIRNRHGIVLKIDHTNLIHQINKDVDASRKLRSRKGTPLPRHYRRSGLVS